MTSLLLHEFEAKQRMSVNNKDIIRMYLGYNRLIIQKILPITASICQQQAMASGYIYLSKLSLSLTFFRVISTYPSRTDK